MDEDVSIGNLFVRLMWTDTFDVIECRYHRSLIWNSVLLALKRWWDSAIAKVTLVVRCSTSTKVSDRWFSFLRFLTHWFIWVVFLSWRIFITWSWGWYLVYTLIVFTMDELASLAIWAISSLHEFLAKLGLVKDWNVSLVHQLMLSVSEWALITILAVFALLPKLTHLSPELMDIGSRWSELNAVGVQLSVEMFKDISNSLFLLFILEDLLWTLFGLFLLSKFHFIISWCYISWWSRGDSFESCINFIIMRFCLLDLISLIFGLFDSVKVFTVALRLWGFIILLLGSSRSVVGWVEFMTCWATWFLISPRAFIECLSIFRAVKDWDTWMFLVSTIGVLSFVSGNELSLSLGCDNSWLFLLVSQLFALSWWGCGSCFLHNWFLYMPFASSFFGLIFPWCSDSIGLSTEFSLHGREFLNDTSLDRWGNISWNSWATLATWVLKRCLLSHFVGSWGGILRSLLIFDRWNFNLIQVFLKQFLCRICTSNLQLT